MDGKRSNIESVSSLRFAIKKNFKKLHHTTVQFEILTAYIPHKLSNKRRLRTVGGRTFIREFTAIYCWTLNILVDVDRFTRLIRKSDDELYDKNQFNDMFIAKFKFFVVTKNPFPPTRLVEITYPITVCVPAWRRVIAEKNFHVECFIQLFSLSCVTAGFSQFLVLLLFVFVTHLSELTTVEC